VRQTSTGLSGSFVRLTFTCIQRVLAVPPIPRGTLSSGNTFEVNCLNYQICTENLKKIECVDCDLVHTHNIFKNLLL